MGPVSSDTARRRRPAGTTGAQIQPAATSSRRAPADASPTSGSDLDAIEADVGLVTAAALENFEGPAWGKIVARLYPYAVDTFAKWLETGEVFQLLFVNRMPHTVMSRLRPSLTYEQRYDFAGDLVADVLERFRRNVLREGKWDSTRGTQLRTFFVHYCLFYFGDRFAKLLDHLDLETPHDLVPDITPADGVDPERAAVASAHLQAVVATAEPAPDELVLLEVWLEDQKLEAAAERLGITYKAVEYRVAKFRDRVRMQLSA